MQKFNFCICVRGRSRSCRDQIFEILLIFRGFFKNISQILCGFIGAFWQKLTTYFLIFFQSVSEEGADRVEIFSDDDDDFSSPEEGSDSEPMLDDQVSTRR